MKIFIPFRVHFFIKKNIYTRSGILMEINNFVKEKRKKEKLTQHQLALKTSVGLRFIRELEKGKKTLRTDKVNQVLNFFGYKLGAVEIEKIEDISSNISEDINSL